MEPRWDPVKVLVERSVLPLEGELEGEKGEKKVDL